MLFYFSLIYMLTCFVFLPSLQKKFFLSCSLSECLSRVRSQIFLFSRLISNTIASNIDLRFIREGAHLIVPAFGNVMHLELTESLTVHSMSSPVTRLSSIIYRCHFHTLHGSCTGHMVGCDVHVFDSALETFNALIWRVGDILQTSYVLRALMDRRSYDVLVIVDACISLGDSFGEIARSWGFDEWEVVEPFVAEGRGHGGVIVPWRRHIDVHILNHDAFSLSMSAHWCPDRICRCMRTS